MANFLAEDDAPAQVAQEAYDPSAGMNVLEAFAANARRGALDAATGVRALWNWATGDEEELQRVMAEKAKRDERFEPLEARFPKASMVGDIAGEAVTTMVPGVGAGMGVVKATQRAGSEALKRYAPIVAGGAVEGAISGAAENAAGQGAVVGAGTGAVVETVLPPLARALSRMWRRAVNPAELAVHITVDDSGRVIPKTPEMDQALKESGVSVDDLNAELVKEMQANSPEEFARAAAFEQEGVTPATRSRIIDDPKSQQVEGWLLRKTDDEAADEFRQRIYLENQQVKDRMRQLASELGLDEQAGESIKMAADGLKSSMASERRAAYKELADIVSNNPELVADFPIDQSDVLSAVADAAEYPLEQSTRNALAKLLRKYGFDIENAEPDALGKVLGDPAAVDLNIGTLEEFRQGVNKVFDQAKPGDRAARGIIIERTNKILDEFGELADEVGIPKAIRDQAKKARALRAREAEVFESGDLTEQLVKSKRPGSDVPLVDAAEVYRKIASTKKVGEIDRLVKNLQRAGPEGLGALSNLQAATVIDLMNKSLTPGARLGGQTAFSGSRFTRALDNFGRDKLKIIFDNNPEVVQALRRLETIGTRRVTGLEAVQRGSIPPDLVNQLYKGLSKIPLARLVAPSETKRALKASVDLRPTVGEIQDFIAYNTPKLAGVLGIVSAGTQPVLEREE